MIESTQIQQNRLRIQPATLDRLASRFDPLQPGRLGVLGWTITALLVVIILLPATFYPLGPDEGLFFVSAQKMLNGAIHYRDIVDIKPPLIYYLYAASIALFGPDSLSIHIVDVILQGLTCLLIISLVRRVGGNDLWGAIAAVSYAMLYFALNYGNVAQPESYAGLLGLPMIWLALFRRTPSGLFLTGLLGGVLFLLKFSLLAMLGVLAVAEVVVFNNDWKGVLRNWAIMGAGFGIMFSLLALYLFAFRAYDDFLLMQQFTSGYVKIQWPTKAEWLRSVAKHIPSFLNDTYSVVMFLGTVIGISMAVPIRHEQAEHLVAAPNAQRLLRICAVLFLVLAVTVAIEGKFLPYHFSRFFSFGAILASFGMLHVIRSFLLVRSFDRFRLFGLAIIIPILIFFSPVPRYFWHGAGVVINTIKDPKAYDKYYNYLAGGDTVLTFTDIRETGNYLRIHRRDEDQVLLASSAGGLVAYEAGYVPDFKIYHFAFITADFSPKRWKDETVEYLYTKRPRFVVAQLYNREPTLSGTLYSSEEALMRLPGVAALFDSAYTLVHHTKVFNVYESNRPR
jgi:hypothetical protein